MGEWFHDTAASGSLLLAIPVALIAGLVSFFSPCVIPLLPGYLSYATGLSGADLERARRGRLLLGSLLFVLGFSLVFVLFGALFGALGEWLFEWRREITVVLGSLTILLGLAFAGLVPFLQRDWRVHTVPAVGLGAAPVLGFLFGLGWTPCIGPTLGRDLHAVLRRRHRRPRVRCWPRSTRSASACPSWSPALPTSVRSAPSAGYAATRCG